MGLLFLFLTKPTENIFEEALEKLGATKEECCTYLNMGDVMKKTDVPAFKAMLRRHTEELQNAMKNEQFAEEQIRTMIDIWNGFHDGDKPEWLTMEQIKDLAQKMGVDI